MDKVSERRLAENEVIFREANRDVQEFIEGDPDRDPKSTMPFYCECSRPECRERIQLTIEAYKELHKSSRQFTVLNGHEIAEVEKIVQRENGFTVVEKFGEPPSPEEIDLALRHIRT